MISGSSRPDREMHHRRRLEWSWLLRGWTPALLLVLLFVVEWPLAGFGDGSWCWWSGCRCWAGTTEVQAAPDHAMPWSVERRGGA